MTSSDRILAVLAHLSALGLGNLNFLPALLWSENRQKSAWLRFQTLQAFGYQTLGYTLWALGSLLLMVAFYGLVILMTIFAPEVANSETTGILIALLVLLSVLAYLLLYLLPPLLGAVLCALGKDFRYPLLGSRLARRLGWDPANPEAALDSAFEERFAAAMGHFAVILPLWGLIAPAWFWLNHKPHSHWLKFQSAQTTLYQIFVNVFYFGIVVVSLLVGLAAAILYSVTSGLGEWPIAVGILTTFFVMLCGLLLFPLLHILGQWAGLQVLLGRDFKYPLLGKWVERKVP